MKNEINESVYDINMDKLCQNSIELIKYARNITAKQVMFRAYLINSIEF